MPAIKYTYTGAMQTFTVPNGITTIDFKVWGAAGGPHVNSISYAGAGGYSYGELNVTPGLTFDIMVGQKGLAPRFSGDTLPQTTSFGGGGAGGPTSAWTGAQGGGRSGVAYTGGTQFIIAGGGGGAGAGSVALNIGGNGGGATGNNQYKTEALVTAATGGTQSAGGTGGIVSGSPTNTGQNGSLYLGGTGGRDTSSGGGGGGGGGYYGGGGGAGSAASGTNEQAGGGGSGFVDTTVLTNATTQGTAATTTGGVYLPPNTTDPDYIAGIGVANSTAASGFGLVVVNLPDLQLTKTVDNKYAAVGDTLTYSVFVKNTGPGTLTNIVFYDTVPTGTSFVNGSLQVNGSPVSGSPNPPGITIPNIILAGEGVTVTFDVTTLSTLPNPIKNQAMSSYGNGQYQYISNQATTTIASPVIAPTKTVSNTSSVIGSTLTYTVTFKNTGNATANNLVFVDTLPNGTTLVANSVTVNGTTRTGVTPNPPGFPITIPVSTITAGATVTVAFKVTITTTPSPNPIQNTAALSYTFTSDPSIPNGNNGTITSTNVSTSVIVPPTALPVKTVDQSNAKIGDVLTYTIAIHNNGTVSESNVVLIDTIPNGTTFIGNSVTLNGITQSGAVVTPPTGFAIGTVSPNTTETVTFQVTVVTIPTTNPIPNSAIINLTYVAPTTVTTSLLSNTVSTTITNAILSSTKTVSEINAFSGDILTYTVVLKNSGNTTANNVLFVDTVPSQTSFVTNSLTINGVTQTGLTPNPPGITIPDIGPQGVATITFNATITTIPSTNPFANISSTGFNFISNPTTGVVTSGNLNSNQVSTFVNPNSNPLKTVSEFGGNVGDILTYTISYINGSNTTVSPIFLFDTVPPGTTFVPNSVKVNGFSSSSTLSPPTGLTILNLAANSTLTVTFNALVNTLPTINPLLNTANMTYYDYDNPTLKSSLTNTVSTEINQAIIAPSTKSVNTTYATVGDMLTYTVAMANTGNVTALNVLLTDTIPNGTTFIPNSIYLNGINIQGAVVEPPTGFNIGTLPVNSIATVTFNVLITTFPNPNPIVNDSTINYDYVYITSTGQLASGSANTNSTSTEVNFANVMYPTKFVDKVYSSLSDILTYTVVLDNIGNTTANNLVFTDTIPTGTTFIANSVTLNGVNQSGAVVAPPTGFTIPTLGVNETSTITFKVLVDNTMPSPNPIINHGTANYSYVINPISLTNGVGSGNTNSVSTQINNADLSGAVKSVDKDFATCSDILTYTIAIPNSGNTTALNVVIADTIPTGTVFVANSVTVNGTQVSSASPSTGINIGTIPAGTTATVTFQVQVQC